MTELTDRTANVLLVTGAGSQTGSGRAIALAGR
jgi:hypothetical protein